MTPPLPSVVVVQNISPALSASYGPRMHVPYDKALVGERKGVWRIVRGVGETIDRPSVIPGAVPTIPLDRPDRMMRVAWVQDNGEGFRGGAEISGDLVAKIGTACGFDVRYVSAREFLSAEIEGADLIVLNNLFNFSPGQMSVILHAIFERRIPYVKYEHDHREIGRPEFSRRLFRKAALNVFLSPSHRENHEKDLGISGICLPLAIDPDRYAPCTGIPRIAGSALACNVRNFKSWSRLQEFIDSRKDLRFTIMARDPLPVHGANVVRRDLVAPEEMPSIYSAHEYLVHLLDGWGAGERVVMEAALCGCKVIANDRVGHVSWGKDLGDREGLASWLRNAPYLFWKEMWNLGLK